MKAKNSPERVKERMESGLLWVSGKTQEKIWTQVLTCAENAATAGVPEGRGRPGK